MRTQAFWRGVHAAAAGLAWQMEAYIDETPSKDMAASWAFRLRSLADYIEGKEGAELAAGYDAESSRQVINRKIDEGIFDLKMIYQALDIHIGEK
jgi:hypothetical protein